MIHPFHYFGVVTDWLAAKIKGASGCYRLLLTFAAERRKTRPSQIGIEDLDATLICAFLDHLEEERANTARSRNARLAAIHSLFRYIEYRVPACLDQARRIHAIPMKRTTQPLVGYLTRPEMQALLAAPDPCTAAGLRDLAMLHLAFAAGLRVSELVSLRLEQFDDAAMPSLHVIGKGRRERILPLWQETARTLRRWIAVRPAQGDPQLFLNAGGRAMTRSGFEYILRKHAAVAEKEEPSIAGKRVTPHVLRHSCAMHTLQATGDVRKVSLWLGHASVQTTEMYLRIDLLASMRLPLNAEAACPYLTRQWEAVSVFCNRLVICSGRSRGALGCRGTPSRSI